MNQIGEMVAKAGFKDCDVRAVRGAMLGDFIEMLDEFMPPLSDGSDAIEAINRVDLVEEQSLRAYVRSERNPADLLTAAEDPDRFERSVDSMSGRVPRGPPIKEPASTRTPSPTRPDEDADEPLQHSHVARARARAAGEQGTETSWTSNVPGQFPQRTSS